MEALNIPEEDFTSALIRYGLYIGAVFQMICLGAVIFMPSNPNQNAGGTLWNYLKVSVAITSTKIDSLLAFIYVFIVSCVCATVAGTKW